MRYFVLPMILLCFPLAGLAGCASGNASTASTSTAGGTGGGTMGPGGGGTMGPGGAGGGAMTTGEGGGTPGPTDRWIAFDSNREQFNRDIYVMRPDGTSLQRLTTEPSTDREPTFSPDGKQIAFASDRVDAKMQIFLLTLETGKATQLTSRPDGADQPAWSADGKLIAFHGGADVYTVKLDGTGEKMWLQGQAMFSPYQHPAFSPDGIWLVADSANLVTAVRLDGTETRLLLPGVPDTQEMVTISPTNALFAFATYCEQGVESVWVAPMSGLTDNPCKTASRLSPIGTPARRPAWGPYGFIAYEAGDDGTSDIMVISDSGGTPVNVTKHPADDRNPAWSPPDGAVIPPAK